MKKVHEVHDPDSCLNRAYPRETLFVLMGRDVAAPNTIRWWCAERVRLGKNGWGDVQIIEAMTEAVAMEREGKAHE